MSTTQPRAVVYARISEDATGEGAGVARQVKDAKLLADTRGWQVVAECVDNDISALRGRHRPGYEQVLELVRGAKVDYVVVWQTSRLLRNRRERAEAIELFSNARVGIISVKGQDLDLSNAYGRGMAGLLGEFDTMESEVKSERVAAAAADRALKGRPNGALGYGWTKTAEGFVEHPEQAAVVREITRRLLSGESLLGVTNDLNARQVPAPVSAAWGKTSVKKIALRPSNVALRVHHRGRDTEKLYEGEWPALVARKDWDRLTVILGSSARRTNGAARPGARKHLLTWGIGRCGVCGAHLRVGLKGNRTYGSKKHLYLCEAKGCVGRDQQRVDDLVAAVLIERLSRPDAFAWLLGDEDESKRVNDRLLELIHRLDEAADSYSDGKITTDQLARITSKLRPQIDAATAELRRHQRSLDIQSLTDLAGPKASERWLSMEVTQRRAVLETLNLKVILQRVTRRGPGFDPESVGFEWQPHE